MKRAEENVSVLRANRRVANEITIYGMYKGVRVGVITTNGKIATIFPDVKQSPNRGDLNDTK